MKKIIASVAFVCLMAICFASCQLSTIVPPQNTTAGSTTLPDGTTTPGATTGSEEQEEPVTHNFMETDLTKFFTLGEYTGIEIEDKRISVTDEMVTRYINELLISAGEFTKQRTGTIEEYTILSMDYVGKLGDVAFNGGTANDFVFLVSENENYVSGYDERQMFISGFAQSMIGKDISTPFDINVTFPENYGEESLAGKAVVFTITVNHILKPNELNETTLKKLTDEENITVDSFKQQTKEDLVAAYDENARASMNVSIWEIIMKNHTFTSLPEEYIQKYFESEYKSIEDMAAVYGMKVEEILSYYGYASKDALREELVESVKQNIILYQIVKDENLAMDDETYEERLKSLAEELGATVDQLKSYYSDEYFHDYFYFEDVTDFLYKNAVLKTPAAQ